MVDVLCKYLQIKRFAACLNRRPEGGWVSRSGRDPEGYLSEC